MSDTDALLRKIEYLKKQIEIEVNDRLPRKVERMRQERSNGVRWH